MEYIDERIVGIQKELERAKYNSIENGVYIEDKLIKFQKINLFNEQMSIMIPQDFVDMPPAIAKIKYPSEKRPQIIKTSYDISTNIAFNLYSNSLKNETVKKVAKQFQKIIRRVNPAYNFYELKEETNGKKNKCWFDFKSYAVDEPLYNIIFLVPINGKTMHGIFNCKFSLMNQWKPVAIQIIQSVQEICKREE